MIDVRSATEVVVVGEEEEEEKKGNLRRESEELLGFRFNSAGSFFSLCAENRTGPLGPLCRMCKPRAIKTTICTVSSYESNPPTHATPIPSLPLTFPFSPDPLSSFLLSNNFQATKTIIS